MIIPKKPWEWVLHIKILSMPHMPTSQGCFKRANPQLLLEFSSRTCIQYRIIPPKPHISTSGDFLNILIPQLLELQGLDILLYDMVDHWQKRSEPPWAVPWISKYEVLQRYVFLCHWNILVWGVWIFLVVIEDWHKYPRKCTKYSTYMSISLSSLSVLLLKTTRHKKTLIVIGDLNQELWINSTQGGSPLPSLPEKRVTNTMCASRANDLKEC